MITSLHNERVKRARLLMTSARARRQHRQIALEGARLVADALDCGLQPDVLFVDPETADEAALRARGLKPLPVTAEVMRHMSDTLQPQGVLGIFPLPAPQLPPLPRRLLILDALRDPGNLGTILRTAAAAGVEGALLSPTCVDPYNPKALRGGMGAHFRLPVIEADWAQIGAVCAGRTVYLADAAGEMVYTDADWSAPWALIVGSEAHGASAEARRLAAHHLVIPMASATESLNAGVAAGIILFEAVRGSHQNLPPPEKTSA